MTKALAAPGSALARHAAPSHPADWTTDQNAVSAGGPDQAREVPDPLWTDRDQSLRSSMPVERPYDLDPIALGGRAHHFRRRHLEISRTAIITGCLAQLQCEMLEAGEANTRTLVGSTSTTVEATR